MNTGHASIYNHKHVPWNQTARSEVAAVIAPVQSVQTVACLEGQTSVRCEDDGHP